MYYVFISYFMKKKKCVLNRVSDFPGFSEEILKVIAILFCTGSI